jgi:hypothetical protein
LEGKVAAPVLEAENTAVGIRHAEHVAPSNPHKLALTSPTSGSRSVGIVRSRTQATEFSLVYICIRTCSVDGTGRLTASKTSDLCSFVQHIP